MSDPKNRRTSSTRLSSQSLAETRKENKQLLQNLDFFFFRRSLLLRWELSVIRPERYFLFPSSTLTCGFLALPCSWGSRGGTMKFFRIRCLISWWCQFKGEPIVWSLCRSAHSLWPLWRCQTTLGEVFLKVKHGCQPSLKDCLPLFKHNTTKTQNV